MVHAIAYAAKATYKLVVTLVTYSNIIVALFNWTDHSFLIHGQVLTHKPDDSPFSGLTNIVCKKNS